MEQKICILGTWKKRLVYDHFFGEAEDPEDCIVVGNIFDNPQLKKKYGKDWEEEHKWSRQDIKIQEYFSKDLCVADDVSLGTDTTDSQVAEGAGTFNLATNEIVYAKNIYERLYPASTTKILTA